jgi:hypothetical protein
MTWNCVQSCSALIPEVHRAAAHRVVPALVPSAPLPPSTQVAGGNSSHVYRIPEFLVTWPVRELRSFAIWLIIVPGSKSFVHHNSALLKGLCAIVAGQAFSGRIAQAGEGHILVRFRFFLLVLKSKPYLSLGTLLTGCRLAPRVVLAKLWALSQMLFM